ncbi:MalY/PatB family protein [Amnibacterium endophyticum]|uniref:cysteine-S-conjugate beta-lyase n=1 Tax=Amnibacterium endophyticum TaxID=2109337 RepID=A0ABW4LKQ5_9MICO
MTRLFETPSVDELRRRGSAKWTAFPGAIGAFVAETDFGLAPVIQEVLRDAIADGRLGYLPQSVVRDLQLATAGFVEDRYGWSVPPEHVRPVGDVLTGLDVFLKQWTDLARPAIVPTPAYMPFLRLPQAVGKPIVEVPSPVVDGRYELDLDGIAAAFEAGADTLILCNPWNPTGRVLTREELLAVAEVVSAHGGRVYSDEIHAPIVFPGHSHVPYASVSEAAAAHTVTAVSASKAFNLPGLKCAQLLFTSDDDAERWDRQAGFAAHGAGILGVLANTAAYTDGGPWLDQVLAYLDEGRRLVERRLAERLPQVGFRAPEGTYIGWLDVTALDLGEQASTAVVERTGVALTDGLACGAAGAGHLRLIMATPHPVLDEIVDRLAGAYA